MRHNAIAPHSIVQQRWTVRHPTLTVCARQTAADQPILCASPSAWFMPTIRLVPLDPRLGPSDKIPSPRYAELSTLKSLAPHEAIDCHADEHRGLYLVAEGEVRAAGRPISMGSHRTILCAS